jgi:hypothetical protein
MSSEVMVFVASKILEDLVPDTASGGTKFYYMEDGDPSSVEYIVVEDVATIVSQQGGSSSIGINEIAFGDSSTGAITSNSLFVRNPANGYISIGAAIQIAAKLYILQNTVATGAKGISVNFNTIGEAFYMDDNGVVQFKTGLGLTVTGANGIINLISNGGANPYIVFKVNNGAATSGTLLGDNLNMFLQPTGNFGIGTTFFNSTGKVHIRGIDPSTGVNLRLEPVATVTEDTSGNTVNTTNATANVTAQTIAIPTDKVVSLESTIVYRKTGGAGVGTTGDGTTIKLNCSVKNVAGILTLDTVQNTYTGTVNALVGVAATYTVSGTDVLVSVTGVVNDNITWNVITKTNTV